MGIGMYSLVLDNVLTYEVEQKKEEWQNGVYEMKSFTLNEDVYKNGPVVFSFDYMKQHSMIQKTPVFVQYKKTNSNQTYAEISLGVI